MSSFPLSDRSLMLLRLHTPSDALCLRDGYVLTDWFQGAPGPNNEWSRFAYDIEGVDGLNCDFFRCARVHYASERGAWMWQVSPSARSRSGVSPKDALLESRPSLAMQMADSQLEICTLSQDDFNESVPRIHLPPHAPPCSHPSRPWRTTTWGYRSSDGGHKRTYQRLYFRTWVLTPDGVASIPSQRRTGLLVERAESSYKPHAAAIKVMSLTRFEWSVSVSPHRESGVCKTVEDAFETTSRLLAFFGARELDSV